MLVSLQRAPHLTTDAQSNTQLPASPLPQQLTVWRIGLYVGMFQSFSLNDNYRLNDYKIKR